MMPKPLKVMFIIPPVTLEERYGKLKDVGTSYPPLGLAYLAAVAEKNGCRVKVLDSEASGYSYTDITSLITEFRPDLIGMQTYCTNINQTLKVAGIAKNIDPACLILLGGAQVTIFPREHLRSNVVDLVIAGEGETVFENLIKRLRSAGTPADYSGIKGLLWKKEGQIIENPKQELITDLDSLPIPARHLFPISSYHASAQLRGKRTLNIMTSRGCPFRCAYCSGHITFGRSFRCFSAQRVIDELRSMIRDFQIDGIQFYDETFTVNRRRVLELCEALQANGIHLPWTCFTRVNLVDPELLSAMKKAGCYQIFFGIESGSQRLLDLIKKDITLDQARKAIKSCKEAGIQSFCSFMLALPSETIQESRQTIDFAIELDPDYAQFPITTPFPGTELYELAQKNGRFILDDWSKFMSWDEIVYLPAGRSPEEIRRTVRLAYRGFYLRPSYLLKVLKRSRQLPFKNTLNLIKAGLKTIFSQQRENRPEQDVL